MDASLSALPDNGRVVIIGGGPGGTACALALNHLAAELDRQVHITLLEGKEFTNERHYNQCVGVLSPPLPTLLEERLGIPFPFDLCQIEIEGYMLYSSGEQIKLNGEEEPSYAVRRVQFDDYMLESVKQHGILVFPARAVDLEFHDDCVIVYTESNPLEADVVVGAFGLDEGSASMFSRMTSYHPPQALNSLVTKYHPGPYSNTDIGAYIHAFLPSNPRIEFGAVTPKCSHLTINIAGNSVDTPLMDSFLHHSSVNQILPDLDNDTSADANNLIFFKGRFPRSLARGYYGDRYVMVGDAAGLVRAFKGKGATTAVLTGIRAAETIMKQGISAEAFHNNYRTANQDITRDLPYGRAFRLLTIFMARFGLLGPVLRAAKNSPDLQSALFDAVSAHGSYQSVLKKSLRLNTIGAVLKAILSGSR
ncbi:MAG: hypothetical protein KAJ53_10500 [Anaerolineales bacterium]|nr:hypothetical protein [Anaerolineales bacterium]